MPLYDPPDHCARCGYCDDGIPLRPCEGPCQTRDSWGFWRLQYYCAHCLVAHDGNLSCIPCFREFIANPDNFLPLPENLEEMEKVI